jgi:CheY-like chemotaxis protein
LVVDDEAAIREFARRALEHHGYRVLLAENGEHAIQVLAAHPEVAAVVLDLAMPVITGDQAAPRLRAINPTLPIILSSGYAEPEARQRLVGVGITSFLQKPYKAATLVERVATSLSSSGASRRLTSGSSSAAS